MIPKIIERAAIITPTTAAALTTAD